MVDFATLFAWFVLIILFAVIVAAVVALGSLPGRIARQSNHPHAAAINVASWLGLIFGGIGWAIAFVWALVPCGQASPTTSTGSSESLSQQVAALQAEVDSLKKQLAQST
ncbi:DUF3302 domain-containing protein [Bremerella cremea]|uniref:DUF3302 domain-containing protein n=1 Tax=Bremerella cremea TaxID=1031537 RepID=A0A368KWC0_9BACT|nr:DUF3302 domain-containing protein [Bremerella cremea]RCS53021.1 DUF3302 domain-containing protein [Bremerella cremea]